MNPVIDVGAGIINPQIHSSNDSQNIRNTNRSSWKSTEIEVIYSVPFTMFYVDRNQ